MELILTSNIKKLGKIGDIVSVKAGYARNYLIPNNKAIRKTSENLKKLEEKRKEIEEKELLLKNKALEITEIAMNHIDENGGFPDEINDATLTPYKYSSS